jgi:hypothetical protein
VIVSELVEPAYFTHPDFSRTLGDEVGELAALAGLPPDPEQQLLLDATFAMDSRGLHSAFEVCVICCRQNLKTGFLKQAALGKAFILDRKLVVWSAHEFSTAQEGFRDLVQMIESCPSLDRRVARITYGNGEEAIELLGGVRIKFKARTKTGGRGLSGEDVFLDEAFALQPTHMGALLPTLSAQEDPQVLYAASAGLVTSEVLRGVRNRGRVGDRRLVYMEFCAPTGGCQEQGCLHQLEAVGCALDDEDNWRRANPALGRRISVDYVRSERRALPPEEFARERLGWWDEAGTADAAFGAGRWEACIGLKPTGIPLGAIGVAASMDLTHGAITAAAADDSFVHLKPLQHGPGTHWVVARALELQAKHRVPVVIDGLGPAAALIPHLEAAGVDLTVLATRDVLDACANILDLVRDRKARHAEYPELDSAVKGAVRRPVGDRWAWGRKLSSSDISTLEAATLAAHAVTLPEVPPVPPAPPLADVGSGSYMSGSFDSMGF